ncbi:MAG: D-beta-D-heptose 1-phosphate adenosyltransferase, partial [Actinobacteria bacterium HGW-Actinobacteria-5]
MYAEERHRTIVNLALRYDRVSVADLATRFDVTTETIRRDLDVLDKRGILRRVHGGAVVAENVALVETALTER